MAGIPQTTDRIGRDALTEQHTLDGSACVVCGAALRAQIAPWTARCSACGTWASDLPLAINEHAVHATTQTAIDDTARAAGLEELRRSNFRTILDCISACVPLDGIRLLDIGSAHGWFLDEAARRGVSGTGVEPDEAIASEARGRGLDIRVGFFPDAVPERGAFDVVTFNDVLEHIPDVRATLAACADVLRPGGVLAINIPNAGGLGYRAACAFARVGVRGPYERFWQHGLPSPHQHYFTRVGLASLVADSGFVVDRVTALSAISRTGLWERVHTFRRVSLASIASFAALWLAAPLLNRPAQSDIILLLARRAETPS